MYTWTSLIAFFAILYRRANSRSNENHSSLDNKIEYENFQADFRPLIIKNKKLKPITMIRKKIIHFTGYDQRKQASAAFLVGCYMIM
ncbi:dual specificity protein phosphatase CDC14B-like isoform X3 [Leptotrombidium deliense]|uniref:Dual specificity protein phosphatase CDC14B-like isoform X3 n=1 Tax=Leptotrombidium deliense TaxID=299467 RepID=A0A443RTC6_9ACAR|nr:dual specificity protein phosphatase CDC14B-like isoform X3 [Leptotrombidium deliense]